MLVKITLLLFVAVDLGSSQDDFWYNMGDWDTHPSIQANPYYQTHQQLQRQMNWFGPALHVGKINRGQFFNPQFNRPRDRPYGYQNDFNYEDFNSGAFRNPSEGQRIRATQAHVDRGLANSIGDIAVMPVGVNVQPDGTILVQTSAKQKNPCNPNPCSKYKMSQCDVVNGVTAKCSQHGDYELALRWSYPDENDMNLYLRPAFHDGTACDNMHGNMVNDIETACGVECGPSVETDFDSGVTTAVESCRLSQLEDDDDGLNTKYQDYTYQVLAHYNDYNPSISHGELVVSYEGEVKQILKIPQYHGEAHVNNNYYHAYYFFGCFRPFAGGYFVDTRGAGFYDYHDYIIGDYAIYNLELCNALRGWTGPKGYNHHDDQSDDADEADEDGYYSTDGQWVAD